MPASPRRDGILTVGDAVLGHRVLEIECQGCGHRAHRWAYLMYQSNPEIMELPVGRPVKGFKCKGCRRSVEVILRPDGPH